MAKKSTSGKTSQPASAGAKADANDPTKSSATQQVETDTKASQKSTTDVKATDTPSKTETKPATPTKAPVAETQKPETDLSTGSDKSTIAKEPAKTTPTQSKTSQSTATKADDSDNGKTDKPKVTTAAVETSTSSASSKTAAPKENVAAKAGTEAKDKPTTPLAKAAPPPAPTREVVVEKRAGFFPMLLGGIAAGAIGYAVADFTRPEVAEVDISGLSAEVQALREQLDARATETPGNANEIENIATALNESVEALGKRVGADEQALLAALERINTLEDSVGQTPEIDLDSAVEAAFTSELGALKSEVAALAEAAKERQSAAEEAARTVAVNKALSEMTIAADNGTAFDSAVSTLEANGVSVDDALKTVAGDGVASLSQLKQTYPEAARAALKAARRSGEQASEGAGFSAFLKTQLGARSLEPQDGQSTDAILSRAEAAVHQGDLSTALAETDTLSEAAKEPLADWRAAAQKRLDAIAALDAIQTNTQ